MIKSILESFKNLEKIAYKIMKNGLHFCFGICIVSIILLLTYDIFFNYLFLYYIGIALFKISLIFGTEFIICAFITDKIKKQLI